MVQYLLRARCADRCHKSSEACCTGKDNGIRLLLQTCDCRQDCSHCRKLPVYQQFGAALSGCLFSSLAGLLGQLMLQCMVSHLDVWPLHGQEQASALEAAVTLVFLDLGEVADSEYVKSP